MSLGCGYPVLLMRLHTGGKRLALALHFRTVQREGGTDVPRLCDRPLHLGDRLARGACQPVHAMRLHRRVKHILQVTSLGLQGAGRKTTSLGDGVRLTLGDLRATTLTTLTAARARGRPQSIYGLMAVTARSIKNEAYGGGDWGFNGGSYNGGWSSAGAADGVSSRGPTLGAT
eukprot:6848942-Prymnesium_polylepis.1